MCMFACVSLSLSPSLKVCVCVYACMNVCLIYIPCMRSAIILCLTVHADLSISTSTPTPCYGDVVTLVCHHPEVATDPERYFTTVPEWREDGKSIPPLSNTETSADLTYTTHAINITTKHFKGKSPNYTCFLILDKNGHPGNIETSENITVDPVGEWPCRSIYDYRMSK